MKENIDNTEYKKPKYSRNYAYIRVSTKEQNEDRQLDALHALKIDIDERDIYIDHWTGTNLDRPYYQAMKRSIRSGDTLYIKSLDRFGRNKQDIKDEWKWFMDNDIDIVVMDTPLISTPNYKHMAGIGKFISDLILEILSWLAEEEVNMIKQRQLEGIESAKLRGVSFGRPRKEIDDKFLNLYKKWKKGDILAVDAIKDSGMSKATFYRRVTEYEESIGIPQVSNKEVANVLRYLKSNGGQITEEEVKEFLNKMYGESAEEENVD